MIWVLTLLYLPLVAESINDLAWYSPATRSAPLSSNPIFATKSVIDLCQLPPDVGSCSKELIRYYYDAKSDECKRFIFSGCGGNSNRFMRRTHCRSRCVQSKEKLTQVSTEYPNFIAKEIQESKHRRTITTAPTTTTTTTTSTSTLSSTNAAVTRPVQMINKTKITPSIRECPHCDPIYGICIDGDCGCIPGFKKLGRICIDINECDSENICPRNSRCVNTIGSHRCDCDSGFTENGECQITQEACTDPFDINLTEEDCNNGEQLIRYYFDHESMRCKQFFYGGCKSTSRNIFSDIQTCDDLCASTPRDHLKAMSIEDSLHLEEVSTQFPMKLDLGLLNVQSVQTTKMPLEEQKKEAQKIVNIMKEVNPNDNVCLREFDEVLRLECVSAEWNERFLWNYEKKECEPFWYDVSCDARDIAGKNFFETLEECQKTCHEDVDSNEPPKDFTQPKKPIELPSFHPSIEEEGQRNAAENIHSIDRHPLLELHEKHQQLKSEQMQIQQAKTSQPYLTFEIPKPTVTSVSETNFHHIFNHQTEQPTNPEDYEEEEIEDDVRPTPIYRHPLEDIPIDEDTEPKKVRKIKKKKITQAPVIITLPDTTQSVTVTPVATTIQPTEHLQEETIQHTETISNQLKKDIDNQLIEATTQIVQEDTTTPYVKIITLPTHVRLAPGPRMDPSPVDSKTSVPSSFDREQYMIEFKKKLMALPDGSSSSNAESSLSGDPTFVLKPSASAPHRPLFTLPPSVFEEATTVSAIPTTHVTHKHRTHHRHRDSNDIFSTPRDLPTTPEPDFETKEKTKVEETLSELDKLNDRCEEPLHPRLEEDCSNENWVIRWYFNTDKQTCKSFWYGGCDSEARNFFQTVYACKAACAHKYPVEQQSLRPNYFIPGTLATRPPIIIPIIKEDFNFQPTLEVKKQNDQSAFGQKSSASVMLEETAATTHFLPTHPPVSFEQNNVDIALKVIEGPTQKTFYTSYEMEQSEQASESLVPFNDVDSQEKGPVSEDPCDDGFDEKWDEDCSNDDWQVRSYYDSSKKSCKKFWWGGCQTSNRNLWKNQQECTDQCGHKWKTDNDKSTSDAAAEAGAVETKQTESSEQQHQPSEAATITSGSGQKKHHHEHQHRHHHADDNGLLQQSSSINHHQKDTLSEPVKPADEIQQAKDELLQKQAFQADLSRQLAEVKRTQENRSDLLYSKAVNHPVTVASECLDPFDKTLEKSCAGGRQWKNRFYYDPDTRECKMFWNDGCFSTSRNNFDDIESCLWKCAGRHPEPAGRGCLEKFDTNYLGDCRHGEFTTRFHFDHEKKRCVAFHWGGCRSSSLNFFIDIGECEEVCERPPRELTQACIQPFDESYTDSCSADGRFQQFYYFDHSKHACQMFWYGNCKSDNQNIFPTLETCQWICERHVEEKIPGHCAVKFDPKYQESCGNGEWEEKWYFDQIGGECSSFWWDGCTSTSQNIFPNEQSCKRHCVHPGYAVESRMPDPETKYRCLEPVEIGNCRETYPAFYYDRTAKVCRPFAYSGCDGNGNRFMTLSQCEGLCYQFNDMADPEMDCYQPLHIGYGKNDDHCLAQASYRFYYDREYGKCSQFWYLGCGGNANNFHSYEVCQRTCQVERRRLERRPEVNSHGMNKTTNGL